MKLAKLLFSVLPITVLASLEACSDDSSSGSPAVDAGTADQAVSADGATADTGGADTSGGDAANGADADASSATISSNPLAPTKLEIAQNVTADLPKDGEHFFEYTPATSGDHTLHFTSPASTFYASHSAVKDSHLCGLPACVMGTGTAQLKGLVGGTTYYLNLYNGSAGAGSYTVSVTYP